MKINKSINARLAELETLISKDLKAIVIFESGERKRLNIVDTVIASLNGAKGNDSPKVTSVEWLGEDKGENGILPQIAEFLIGADYPRNIDGKC